MKRAIYVGKPWSLIRYGSTGRLVDVLWAGSATRVCFVPDGDSIRYWTVRAELYIPSEDQQRHCPKPV